MGKLLDRLRKEYGVQPAAKRHDVNFLVHRADIAEALREGWTAKHIWTQMRKDGTTCMSYVHFCRLVRKSITLAAGDAHAEGPSVNTSEMPSQAPVKQRTNGPAEKSSLPEKELAEEERLALLKEEAFRSVRSSKPAGSLIGKPKSREEENRELFGDQETIQ